MRWFPILLLYVFAVMPTSARAQFPFIQNKKPQVTQEERLGQLILTAKSEADERKRASAVQELRNFDGKAFPEIGLILADVLQNDKSAGVRMEAASSLARIRPFTQEGGLALEYAAARDENLRVRWQAKHSLKSYQSAGYRPTNIFSDQNLGTMQNLQKDGVILINPGETKPVSQPAPRKSFFPFFKTKTAPAVPSPAVPRALPAGPSFSTAIPRNQDHSLVPPPPLPFNNPPPPGVGKTQPH